MPHECGYLKLVLIGICFLINCFGFKQLQSWKFKVTHFKQNIFCFLTVRLFNFLDLDVTNKIDYFQIEPEAACSSTRFNNVDSKELSGQKKSSKKLFRIHYQNYHQR